jgi:DNA polymerase III delta subunit
MLEVYFGSDRRATVDAAKQAVKKIGGHPITVDEHGYVPGLFDDLTSSVSLFGETGVYVIDTPSSAIEFSEACMSAISDMVVSTNHFIIIEGTLLASQKKRLVSKAQKVEEFTAQKPDEFNRFAITDAFSRKDKKTLWVLLQEAYLVGIRDEEVVGLLWWQLKTLRLATVADSARAAGMKDYPYRKAKQALKYFSKGELETLAQSLLVVYHDGHKGVRDMRLALERWVLSIK